MTSTRLRLLAVLTAAVLFTGCWDLETEIRLLPDGSGFLTTWVRMESRKARLVTAMSGSGLDAELDEVRRAVRQATMAAEGVDFVDDAVYEEGDRLVLRHRILFDGIGALNAFWASEAAASIPVLFSGAKMEFTGGGGPCGSFRTSLTTAKRDPSTVFSIDNAEIGRLDAETRDLWNREMLAGQFRLRLVPPGDVTGHDAPAADIEGYPIYEKNLYELFAGGLSARMTSRLECGSDFKTREESKGVTVGAVPDAVQVNAVMAALPAMGHTVVEFTQTDSHRAHVHAVITVDPPLDDAVKTYLPILMAALPGATAHTTMSVKEIGGKAVFEFATREPIDFRNLENGVAYFGRDGAIDVFRMLLPASPYAQRKPEGSLKRPLLTVKVRFRGTVDKSNAQSVTGDTAVWEINDEMLKTPVTLEAISYRGLLKP